MNELILKTITHTKISVDNGNFYNFKNKKTNLFFEKNDKDLFLSKWKLTLGYGRLNP